MVGNLRRKVTLLRQHQNEERASGNVAPARRSVIGASGTALPSPIQHNMRWAGLVEGRAHAVEHRRLLAAEEPCSDNRRDRAHA
jgi:hypothetical protein